MLKKEDKDLLLSKIDIVDLVSEYVDLTKAGASFKGLSPFKTENTPSFVVSPGKKIFKDFSSGIGGDAITFYMKINNLSYLEAIDGLARKYNLNINLGQIKNTTDRKFYDIMRQAANYFKENLSKSEIAKEYLKRRSYGEEDIQKFYLGYADDSWDGLYNEFKDKFELEDLIELGLVSKSQNDNIYDTFRGRIMFPIINEHGDIVGFGGRDITNDNQSAKYINSKESKIFKKSNELFGIFDGGEKIKKYDSCILVEGFFDVLQLQKNNIVNTIASLGTALTESQVKYIKKFTSNIVISYDDDSAGLEAKVRAINLLNKHEFNIKIMNLEKKAKDPDEFINKYGKDEFVDLYKKSVDAFDFLYEYYLGDRDIKKLATKTDLIKSLNEYFSSLKNKIYYDEFIKKLASKLEIEIDTLKSKIKYNNSILENKKDIPKIKKVYKRDKRYELEELTIAYLIKNPKEKDIFKNFSFENEILGNIYSKIGNNELELKENTVYFDIFTKYMDIRLINISRIYKYWLELYIEDSMNVIIELYNGNLDAMPKEKFTEYFKILKRIKAVNENTKIEDMQKIFEDYLEYEKGNLNA